MSAGWIPVKFSNAVFHECPFCYGEATFLKNKEQPDKLMVAHYPKKGVVCPARFEQFCDSVEQGLSWWNDRSKKKGIDK